MIQSSYGGVNKMDMNMRKIELQPFVKYIVLKVDLLMEAEIVDEENFAIDDEFGILRFKRKYVNRDDCVIVKVEM